MPEIETNCDWRKIETIFQSKSQAFDCTMHCCMYVYCLTVRSCFMEYLFLLLGHIRKNIPSMLNINSSNHEKMKWKIWYYRYSVFYSLLKKMTYQFLLVMCYFLMNIENLSSLNVYKSEIKWENLRPRPINCGILR